MRSDALRQRLWVVVSLALVGGFVGCSYPSEVINANQAVETARQAGKDKQCPDEFLAAEKLKDEAYALCRTCDTTKAIALAREATEKANALCPARPVAVVEAPPAPAKPPAPAASVSLSASPASLQQGQCATLTWSSSNASSVSIDHGVGKVDPSGSRQVCPDRTTQYRASAVGEGGSRDASTTVTVSQGHRSSDPSRQLRLQQGDDSKAGRCRPAEGHRLHQEVPGSSKISLVGYTDSIGSETYNQGLSEKRAEAVKAYLVKHGIDGARIQTSGRGEGRSRRDNATEKGRFENRRVEVLILSD